MTFGQDNVLSKLHTISENLTSLDNLFRRLLFCNDEYDFL